MKKYIRAESLSNMDSVLIVVLGKNSRYFLDNDMTNRRLVTNYEVVRIWDYEL